MPLKKKIRNDPGCSLQKTESAALARTIFSAKTPNAETLETIVEVEEMIKAGSGQHFQGNSYALRKWHHQS